MADQSDPLYLTQYSLHGKPLITVERGVREYRLCGPKANGQQRLVARAKLDRRDQQNLARLLDDDVLAKALTQRTESNT